MQSVHSAKEITSTWITALALYFIAAASTIHLTSNGRDIASLWPANAILVALLLVDGRAHWKTVLSAGFVANIAANFVTRGSIAGPMLYGISNVVEVAIVAGLLGRGEPGSSILQSSGSVLRFLIIAGLVGPITSGTIGAFTAYNFFGEPIGKSFLDWVASDALGLLVFTPFFFALFRGEFVECYNGKNWLDRAEAAGLLVLTTVVAYLVFFVAAKPLLFLLFPPAMLVTFRVGRIGVKAAVVVIAIIGSIATMRGHGPIVGLTGDPAGQAHLFQGFLAVLLLTCLPVAAEVTARGRLVKRLDAHDREMTHQAMTDALTSLLNRAGLENMARKFLSSAADPVSLAIIDFDHFKHINDRWGHQVGDLALQHVATTLQRALHPGDSIGRVGGDEFVLLLRSRSLEAAAATCERLRDAVRASPFRVDPTSTMLISLSIGIATSERNETYEQLLGRADRALYDAKRDGRNRVCTAA